MNRKPLWVIVGDGAASGNPGSGGYGTVVVSPHGKVWEFGGALNPATNNQMELQSLVTGLEFVIQELVPGSKVKIIMDSKYVLDGLSKSISVWKKNNWTTSTGQPLKNPDYWKKLEAMKNTILDQQVEIEYQLVKGHAGYELNERVDQIAVAYSTGKPIHLYSGDHESYPVSLSFDGPTAQFEPVYLSYVEGKLTRHKTWPECERHVKGKPGAKYKKVTNRLQEQEFLKLWAVKE